MSKSGAAILLLYALTALLPGAALAAEKDSFDAFARAKVADVQKRHNIRAAYDVKDEVGDAGIGKAPYFTCADCWRPTNSSANRRALFARWPVSA